MKIMINALSARGGGGQTYLTHLLERLPEDSANEVFIVCPDTLVFPIGRANIHRLVVPACLVNNPFLRAVWEFLVLPRWLRRLEIDVLFCLGGSVSGRIPLSCKVVVSFHNMMPFDLKQRRKYPLGYMRLRNWLLEKLLLKGMKSSDFVIFLSEHAKSTIEKRIGGFESKGIVIPHGVDPRFRRPSDKIAPCPAWLPEEGYFLYVSTLDVYKAQVEVIQSYALLKQRRKVPQKLVLIGPEYHPYGEKVRATIKDLGLTDDVLVREAIPNDELPPVYQHATVNIFASETENCPFILLEALAAGRPLFVSNRPPMPEFGGDAVVYFDPSMPTDLTDKLAMVLDNTTLMEELSAKALKQSFQYDWDKTARQTWESIKKISPQKDSNSLSLHSSENV